MKKAGRLACPGCGSGWFARIFEAPKAPALQPGWVLPCADCLSFATVTPKLKLRRATEAERCAVMEHGELRKLVESFVGHTLLVRALRVRFEELRKEQRAVNACAEWCALKQYEEEK